MDLELEKYVKKQRQLQKQIEELFTEKKILQNKICVLNECLSLEKVKQKISELENKQKILTSLEIMVDKLKTDIKPLDYLKQVLQRQLMVSTLSTNDLNIDEQKDPQSSMITVNSGCAIETLDSVSDISSEDSIVILSEYDVVLDEEVCENTEKSVTNKVMYNEALQMATSMHLTPVESSISNIGCLGIFPNVSDQINNTNHLVQSVSKDSVTLMNASCKSEHLLEMYDIVNEKDFQNDEIKLKCNTGTFDNTIHKVHQLCVFNEVLEVGDPEKISLESKECDNVSNFVNDSWVKVDTNKSLEISIENEPIVGDFKEITEFQKNNIISNVVNMEVETHIQNDQLYNYQLKLKDISEIESLESVGNAKHSYKNENHNPVYLSNHLNNEIEMKLSILNIEDSTISKKYNESKVNIEVETQGIKEIKSFENVPIDIDCSYIHEIHSSVCSSDSLNDEIKIKSSLLNIDDSNISRECNDLLTNVNHGTLSSINTDEKSICYLSEFNTMGLKIELLNGIHLYGFQNLTALQLKYLPYCINGRNIIFHSYPCVGKSTMCFISLLQRIDTSLNICQAIVLVPTLELALSAQKIITSLGKFLNVSTCIGDFDVPLNVSLVPHVVISTPCGLFNMIKCNSLCKDFIKMLLIDDAEEMFKCLGFFNQIRSILLFLNNDCQLIILSTSKLEEILDQFFDIMQNPECIIVSDEKPSLDHILQYYVNVPEDWKFDALCELYKVLHLTQTIVYCNTCDKSLEIAENMRLKTCTVSIVHNDMDTIQRQLILRQFRSGNNRVLVTSGLLRGEDFSDVKCVINYDFPKSPKDYLRRIVGCFGYRVKVINFITTNNITDKENIEITFNVYMKKLSEDVSDLNVSSN